MGSVYQLVTEINPVIFYLRHMLEHVPHILEKTRMFCVLKFFLKKENFPQKEKKMHRHISRFAFDEVTWNEQFLRSDNGQEHAVRDSI